MRIGIPRESAACAALSAALFVSAHFADPAEAAVSSSPVKAGFDVGASNDYRVGVHGEGREVRVTVEDEESLAVYRVKGRVSTQRLVATFGDLGRIAVRFRPTGRIERRLPSKGCKGKPRVSQGGVFVGQIRFRGEKGYVRVNARRATGSVTRPTSWRCKGSVRSEDDSVLEGIPFDLPLLSAFTPHRRVIFGAVGSNKSEKEQSSLFVGGTLEKHGSMQVGRAAFAEGGGPAFRFKGDFSEATVAPPKPFRGTGTFVRNADGTTSWTGDLTVALPGADAVPLTGSQFTVDLTRPKTFKEFLEVFGLVGLLE